MPGWNRKRRSLDDLRISPLAYRPYFTVALCMKGKFVIRGRISSKLALFVLFGAAVAASQGPVAESPDDSAEQAKISHTETVVVSAPGEFRDEQELQSPALLE